MTRMLLRALLAAALVACDSSTGPRGPMRPQTVVLFATPKIIADFGNPAPDVAAFLAHYEPLTSRAAETILIFSVGNSDHILLYQGLGTWNQQVDWARITDHKAVSNRTLTYDQIAAIVAQFRTQAAARGLVLKVYDQIDSGNEFTLTNDWKYVFHRECMDFQWHSFDVRATLKSDERRYATAPGGIVAGRNCGEFLVDQSAVYLSDLGFDGILYDNQLGTRGRWLAEMSPGRSDAETAAISAFFEYSERELGELELMWFDSYNRIEVERDRWSFPEDGYGRFDYLIASGFCVITNTERYAQNLRSKLTLRDRTKVLATLDYLDPWYSYKSMVDYRKESEQLEFLALVHKYDIDGIVFFANGADGQLIPRSVIESFASRFFED